MSAGQDDGRALRRPRFAYIRWTILGLFVLAMVLNYLSRSVLGVAAPMVLSEQSISSEQYSWITSAFQLGVMFQPAGITCWWPRAARGGGARWSWRAHATCLDRMSCTPTRWSCPPAADAMVRWPAPGMAT